MIATNSKVTGSRSVINSEAL